MGPPHRLAGGSCHLGPFLGPPWGLRGALWAFLGKTWRPPETLSYTVGPSCGPSGAVLRGSWGFQGPSWPPRNLLRAVMRASCGPPAGLLRGFCLHAALLGPSCGAVARRPHVRLLCAWLVVSLSTQSKPSRRPGEAGMKPGAVRAPGGNNRPKQTYPKEERRGREPQQERTRKSDTTQETETRGRGARNGGGPEEGGANATPPPARTLWQKRAHAIAAL